MRSRDVRYDFMAAAKARAGSETAFSLRHPGLRAGIQRPGVCRVERIISTQGLGLAGCRVEPGMTMCVSANDARRVLFAVEPRSLAQRGVDAVLPAGAVFLKMLKHGAIEPE